MNTELKILIDDYYRWLRSQTHLIEEEETGWTAISTPYTGIFNDGIEIYCRKEKGNWILTDGGDSLKLLEEVGVSISRSKKRKDRKSTRLNSSHVAISYAVFCL